MLQMCVIDGESLGTGQQPRLDTAKELLKSDDVSGTPHMHRVGEKKRRVAHAHTARARHTCTSGSHIDASSKRGGTRSNTRSACMLCAQQSDTHEILLARRSHPIAQKLEPYRSRSPD
eukprot:354449-Chlamydomonas_euryale.AAC.5